MSELRLNHDSAPAHIEDSESLAANRLSRRESITRFAGAAALATLAVYEGFKIASSDQTLNTAQRPFSPSAVRDKISAGLIKPKDLFFIRGFVEAAESVNSRSVPLGERIRSAYLPHDGVELINYISDSEARLCLVTRHLETVSKCSHVYPPEFEERSDFRRMINTLASPVVAIADAVMTIRVRLLSNGEANLPGIVLTL